MITMRATKLNSMVSAAPSPWRSHSLPCISILPASFSIWLFRLRKFFALICQYILLIPVLGMSLSLAMRIPIGPRCSKNDYRSGEKGKNGKGDELSVDWDKAWSSYKKKVKKSFFSQFKPDRYVSWNPRRSEYPLSEEFDPIKRTERSNLAPWTSPNFTLVGAILVVSLLLIYTLQSPLK